MSLAARTDGCFRKLGVYLHELHLTSNQHDWFEQTKGSETDEIGVGQTEEP